MVYSDSYNTNSIVYQHKLLSYQLKTSHGNFSRAATLHLCNMADRGEKLQQPHCYHPFSDSRDTYLTKSHYENYSPKMVPTNPTGSWTIRLDSLQCLKRQDHTVSPLSNWLAFLSYHINQITIPKMQLFGNLTLQKSKVKVMVEVKIQGQIVHPVPNRCTSFLFHTNRANHSGECPKECLTHPNFLKGIRHKNSLKQNCSKI